MYCNNVNSHWEGSTLNLKLFTLLTSESKGATFKIDSELKEQLMCHGKCQLTETCPKQRTDEDLIQSYQSTGRMCKEKKTSRVLVKAIILFMNKSIQYNNMVKV